VFSSACEDQITSLPKVELHCHLEGIIDLSISESLCRQNPDYPIRPENFEGVYPVKTFDDFLTWWRVVQPVWGQFGPFAPILLSYVETARKQNVRYLEIMISSSLIPGDPVEATEVMGGLRRMIDRLEAGIIQVEMVACIPRHRPPEEIEPRIDVIERLFEENLIAGVGLAGLEKEYPVKPLRHIFSRLHEAGMGIEIHAGEWCGPESVRDALDYGYPDRIGHGVSLFKDPALIDEVLERGIHVEMCPVSNVKTGSVARIEDHPIAAARELRMSYSVNTDDPGIFQNSLNSEYALLERVFGFTKDDFRKIYTNSLAARFQPGLRIPPGPQRIPPGPQRIPAGPQRIPAGPQRIPAGPQRIPAEKTEEVREKGCT